MAVKTTKKIDDQGPDIPGPIIQVCLMARRVRKFPISVSVAMFLTSRSAPIEIKPDGAGLLQNIEHALDAGCNQWIGDPLKYASKLESQIGFPGLVAAINDNHLTRYDQQEQEKNEAPSISDPVSNKP